MSTRAAGGRWGRGQSGNPAGRKAGSGVTQRLRTELAAHLPEVIAALVDRAKGGDPSATKLVLERVLPALRPVEQPVAITLPVDDLRGQAMAVLQAIGTGDLAPGQAAQLLAGIGAAAKAVEVHELEARIAALENQREDE